MDRFYAWLRSLPGATDADDLRLDTLKEIAPIIYIIGGTVIFRGFAYSGEALIATIIVGIVLLIGAIGAQRMKEHNFRFAWSWLVFWILVAISFESWGFPESPARFYFPIAIFAASLLTYVSNIIIVSVASAVSVGIIALIQGRTLSDLDYVLYPWLFIALLGMVTFITSRHLHEEVQRSRFSSGRVREMLEQLRSQRVELDKTIKTLEYANQRIETMNVELVEARNVAETADRLKTEFLAHMSHELRTPLNAILNFTAFVADGLMGDVNEEQIETLQKVMDSGNHLLSLINDILDISKIEAGMMNLFIEEVDLNAILKGTLSTTKGLVKNRPVELIAEIDDDLPMISGDKRRIRQIFLNLASNAVKFTPDGTITIKASQKDGEIHVAVQDTGVGIAKEEQAIVFETFKQAQHDLETTPGTGLGLPICKHFIEAHGGTISLESEKGKGTIFSVTLPLVTEALETPEIETVVESLPQVVVEDSDVETPEIVDETLQAIETEDQEIEVSQVESDEVMSSEPDDEKSQLADEVVEPEPSESIESPDIPNAVEETLPPEVEDDAILPEVVEQLTVLESVADESLLQSVSGGNGHQPETKKPKKKLSRIVL
jgi:signal transduction histidine kinase